MARQTSMLRSTVTLVVSLIALAATGLSQAADPALQSLTASLKTQSGVIDRVSLPNISISDRVYLISDSTMVRYAGRNVKPTTLSKGMRVEFKVAPYNGIDGPQPILEIEAK